MCLPFHHQGQKVIDQNALDSASLPVEHRGGGAFGPNLAGPHLGGGPQLSGTGYGPPPAGAPDDPWPLAQPDMNTIKNLQVCVWGWDGS